MEGAQRNVFHSAPVRSRLNVIPYPEGIVNEEEQARNNIPYQGLSPEATYGAGGGSSNGRTADSDSVNLGSNPSPPAKRNKAHPEVGLVAFGLVDGSNLRSTKSPGAILNARSAARRAEGRTPGVILVPCKTTTRLAPHRPASRRFSSRRAETRSGFRHSAREFSTYP